MRLYQLRSSPHRSTYINGDGQLFYKTETPISIRKQVTTINKAKPGSSTIIGYQLPSASEEIELEKLDHSTDKDKAWARSDDAESLDYDDDEYAVDTPDKLEQMARIEWSWIGSSVIDWNGQKTKTGDFFTRSGVSTMGSHRSWRAPDGKMYRWEQGWMTPKLFLDDGSSPAREIASFHRRVFHFTFGNEMREWLEISPEGEHILDAILITYIYVERLRKNRERGLR